MKQLGTQALRMLYFRDNAGWPDQPLSVGVHDLPSSRLSTWSTKGEN